MIWTDCDREGEHIGSEIVAVCRRSNPNIIVKRARFSAIIATCLSAPIATIASGSDVRTARSTTPAATPSISTGYKRQLLKRGWTSIYELVQR